MLSPDSLNETEPKRQNLKESQMKNLSVYKKYLCSHKRKDGSLCWSYLEIGNQDGGQTKEGTELDVLSKHSKEKLHFLLYPLQLHNLSVSDLSFDHPVFLVVCPAVNPPSSSS